MTCKQPLFFMVVLVTVTLSNFTAGQVTTGIPPFQSFDGGPEVINLGNLNVHYLKCPRLLHQSQCKFSVDDSAGMRSGAGDGV